GDRRRADPRRRPPPRRARSGAGRRPGRGLRTGSVNPAKTDLVVIFRTHSDIEAQIVRGLLETHGIMSVVSSDVLHAVFPLSVDGLSEVRISVHSSEAEEAQRTIDAHRTELKSGQVVRLRDEFDALQ